jgi:hypothetical protein
VKYACRGIEEKREMPGVDMSASLGLLTVKNDMGIDISLGVRMGVG